MMHNISRIIGFLEYCNIKAQTDHFRMICIHFIHPQHKNQRVVPDSIESRRERDPSSSSLKASNNVFNHPLQLMVECSGWNPNWWAKICLGTDFPKRFAEVDSKHKRYPPVSGALEAKAGAVEREEKTKQKRLWYNRWREKVININYHH